MGKPGRVVRLPLQTLGKFQMAGHLKFVASAEEKGRLRSEPKVSLTRRMFRMTLSRRPEHESNFWVHRARHQCRCRRSGDYCPEDSGNDGISPLAAVYLTNYFEVRMNFGSSSHTDLAWNDSFLRAAGINWASKRWTANV